MNGLRYADIYNHDFVQSHEVESSDNNENEAAGNNNDGPISCLRPSTINLLSTMLNPPKIIPTESGLRRDWRGLAELVGLTSESISFLQSRPDPTSELLKMWSTSTSVSSSMINSKNITELKTFLCVIDRFDVVEDSELLLEKDIAFHKSRLLNHSISCDAHNRSVPELDATAEAGILTYDDQIAGKGKTRYDAFLLYSEDDVSFAMQIVEKMEQEYKLKMCLKERDLLPGVMFEHEVIGKLIEERCNRLLVIFSPSFLESEGNKFLVSYAQAVGLELRQRKIIPCVYKHCTLPASVRFSFCLDYNRSSRLWDFWDRLRQSLVTVPSRSSEPLSVAVNETPQTHKSIESSKISPSNSSEYGVSLPSDISWWEPSKVPQSPPLSSSLPHSSGSGYSVENSSSYDDSLSLHSEDPLFAKGDDFQATDKAKSKKWIKKLLRPMKRKHKDKSNGPTQLAVLDS